MSTPLTAWQRLRAGNERFFVPVRGHRGGLAGERPAAAVFRCADAGLASEMVFGQSWGSLVDVSTWGHVIDAGVLSTLEFAVDTLQVPLVVVLGHQDCQAIRTAMRAWTEADMPQGATRATVEHAFGSIAHRCTGAASSPDTTAVDQVAAAHIVETGLALLERSPAIARRVDGGQCGIVCATVDPSDGGLRVHATVGAVGEAPDALLECV